MKNKAVSPVLLVAKAVKVERKKRRKEKNRDDAFRYVLLQMGTAMLQLLF